MVQIIPQTPSLGELLGGGIGKGFAEGMKKTLADRLKLQTLTQKGNETLAKQGMSYLKKFEGLADEKDEVLSEILERAKKHPQTLAGNPYQGLEATAKEALMAKQISRAQEDQEAQLKKDEDSKGL